jgi:hypothetical protein
MGLLKKEKSAVAILDETLAEEVAAPPVAEAPDADDDGIDDSATLDALTAVASPDEEDAAASDTDSLLSMFGEVGIETVDRSALLAITPDVEMDDLVTELGLVAAALGIVQGQHLASEPQYGELAA